MFNFKKVKQEKMDEFFSRLKTKYVKRLTQPPIDIHFRT